MADEPDNPPLPFVQVDNDAAIRPLHRQALEDKDRLADL